MRSILIALFLLAAAALLPAKEEQLIKLPGNIRLDMDNKKIYIPIEVVNNSGALEFIVSTGKAKDYESLLSSPIKGRDLHFALTSVGFQTKPEIEKDADKSPMEMALFLRLEDTKELKPITDFLMWSDKKSVDSNKFIFQGSYFRPVNGKNAYEADLSLNLIAAFPADDMVVGPAFKVGNPYDNESKDPALMPKPAALPKLGTKGDLLIMPFAAAKAP